MVEIHSPFPPEDVPRIWAWIEPFRSRIFDDFSPQTLRDFISWFASFEDPGKSWGVYRDGELGGVITFQKLASTVGIAHCIFKKSFWGEATTLAALRQAGDLMLAEVPKLSFSVMEGNKAMIGMLTKAGAVHEGILRRQTLRNGKPTDVILLALFRPEAETGKETESNRKVIGKETEEVEAAV